MGMHKAYPQVFLFHIDNRKFTRTIVKPLQKKPPYVKIVAVGNDKKITIIAKPHKIGDFVTEIVAE